MSAWIHSLSLSMFLCWYQNFDFQFIIHSLHIYVDWFRYWFMDFVSVFIFIYFFVFFFFFHLYNGHNKWSIVIVILATENAIVQHKRCSTCVKMIDQENIQFGFLKKKKKQPERILKDTWVVSIADGFKWFCSVFKCIFKACDMYYIHPQSVQEAVGEYFFNK